MESICTQQYIKYLHHYLVVAQKKILSILMFY